MKISQANLKNLKSNKEFLQMLRFGSVGLLNTGVDFLVFTILVYTFNIKPEISQAFSYSAGTLNSFILNKKWTFKASKASDTKLQLLSFIIINGISLALSAVCVSYLIEDMHMNKLVSKAAVTLLTQVINYLGYKLVVFK